MATWREDVVRALTKIGGQGHLSEIYRSIEKIRQGPLPQNFHAIVRRELEHNSSDSIAYLGKRDLFRNVKGIGEGVWSLRKLNVIKSETTDLVDSSSDAFKSNKPVFGIACTDLEWFELLKTHPTGQIVNFWTPTPWKVASLTSGDLFYFMLKAPIRKIGGYGTFVSYQEMTASEAWHKYGLNNGVYCHKELVDRIKKYVRKNTGSKSVADPIIGCIELANVITLDEDDYFAPEDYGVSFPIQVVKYKKFELPSIPRASKPLSVLKHFELVERDQIKRRRVPLKERKGQSAFRSDILKTYNQRCCISGEIVSEILQAAHIQPYLSEASNHIQNGLCLRADLHGLFDRGLISISEDYKVITSERLKGSSYEPLHGKSIWLPDDLVQRPSLEAIAYHRSEFFA